MSRLSGAGLEDILSLQTFWKALEPPGPLGPTYSAELRGRAVVVKTVDVFDASFCAEDPCALLRLKSAARSLQDVAPHPNLLPPIATAVVRLQQGAR